jgi:hypothetical protein
MISSYYSMTLFVLNSCHNGVSFVFLSLCGVFYFSVLVHYLFVSGWKIKFKLVQIKSMTFMLSMLPSRRHIYFRHFSHICSFMQFVALLLIWMLWVCLWMNSFFFSDFKFVSYQYIILIWMNEYCLFNEKYISYKKWKVYIFYNIKFIYLKKEWHDEEVKIFSFCWLIY